ncbi:MAG: LysM peptidoglycan-binding domain-containing protein, partial [Candidatus Latescibacterota bacterium]
MLAAAQAASSEVHVVRRGETLGHIAERYGVRVDQLRQWNRIQGDRIVVGQRLALRAVAQPSRPARARAKQPAVDPLQAQFDSWEKSVIARSKREGCYALVVNKSERRMDVYLRGKQVTSFHVALSYADRSNLGDR